MDTDEVTRMTLAAWDEIQTEEETGDEDESTEEEHDQEETPEEPEQEDDDEGEDADEEEPEEEDDEEEETEEDDEQPAPGIPYETEDLEIRAFLAKYGGDIDQALKGAAELAHVVGRQGHDKAILSERIAELEGELQQARTFSPSPGIFSEEQRDWVETAVGSGNPAAYVNEALRAGEYDLARAVVQEWAREDPYSALRAGQFIDQAQAEVQSYVEPVDLGRLLDALKTEIPELPNYSAQMVNVMNTLGENHPVVQDARSADVSIAARGIVGIYEIARASSASVKNARDDVRTQQRQNGTDARRKAVVSSASASPSRSETPRTRQIGPGLTFEQLEAEFARQ